MEREADLRLLFQDVGLVDDEVVGVQQSSSPGPVDSGGASVQITVQMVVDPDRRATAPESAIRGYERKRVFHIFQVGSARQDPAGADGRMLHCPHCCSHLPIECRNRHTS